MSGWTLPLQQPRTQHASVVDWGLDWAKAHGNIDMQAAAGGTLAYMQ